MCVDFKERNRETERIINLLFLYFSTVDWIGPSWGRNVLACALTGDGTCNLGVIEMKL